MCCWAARLSAVGSYMQLEVYAVGSHMLLEAVRGWRRGYMLLDVICCWMLYAIGGYMLLEVICCWRLYAVGGCTRLAARLYAVGAVAVKVK
jgi:hypothetical protein